MHFPYRAKNSFFSSLTQTKDTNNHYNHWSFYNKMKARFLCFLVFLLHILSLVCVSSRPFLTANDGHALVNQADTDRSTQSALQITPSTNEANYKSKSREMEEGEYKENSKMGSRPPSCEHKCYGCIPCEAIQVPTSNALQYTNYLPEGWKCKCGHTFYTP
ncbi:EPIDERMAL PATTERNING FACTOR-like protein 6 isoform X1 [Olea europaea var. sylvestris]|uniref:EPIDERMAL PATTERNING FACTOR-like protein 6 isoform X1 n=1 Tax=Olea europaea var. sylvestris TaxID=158386 RepID=UPI000C1CF3BF|nr:EPIDERMAL PATTERNING FACTOR-like protein 6 isoform X1 [Olea europaea var. sylvestris]